LYVNSQTHGEKNIMSRKMVLFALTLLSIVVVAACGTIPDPVFKITPEAQVVESGDNTTIAQAPTSTPLAPTPTPVPPTATPEPTLAPTQETTEVVTEMASEAVAMVIGDANYGATDPQKFGIDNFGDATRGEALFNQTWDLPSGEQWACSQCHNIVGDEEKIGPSLYNVGERALTRIEGEGPYTYLYNSIFNSQAYIVPGYEEKTHMPMFNEVLGNTEIYHLIKYLLTLHGE
jgi:cytochrome c2